jgi:hypothetical protein
MNITRTMRLLLLNTRLLKYQKPAKIQKILRYSSVFSKSPDYLETPQLDLATFESLCTDTLENLNDYFEELVETDEAMKNADISYSVS